MGFFELSHAAEHVILSGPIWLDTWAKNDDFFIQSQNVAKYHLVWEKRVKSQYYQLVILLIDVAVVCSMNI